MNKAIISLPSGFVFGEVPRTTRLTGSAPTPPSLGALTAFNGNWTGHGFNTIFRPDHTGSDNVLELNLTSENLAFSPALGSVPNRGLVQSDIFLNGIPYLQAINDVTTGQPIGIHVEPGIWIAVPATTDPEEVATLVRMASIPHGTTIEAQGTSTSISGAPTIPPVNITPTLGGSPISFPSQTANVTSTFRIPQDLTPFIAAGTITQAILDDPNTVLRNHINAQKIVATTIISVATQAAPPITGGGTDNIAFLTGGSPSNSPNAQTAQMSATFWIETVEETIVIPIFKPGQPPLTIKSAADASGRPTPRFIVRPPVEIPIPRPITIRFTQIQYSQNVTLFFNGLSWPHVSVATLVQSDDVVVQPVGGW
jgi:hypothetical protein